MNATSGISSELGDRSWRKISINLTDRDLFQAVRDGRVPGWTVEGEELRDDSGSVPPMTEQFRHLMRLADTLLLLQMAREGMLTKEEAQRRVKEL